MQQRAHRFFFSRPLRKLWLAAALVHVTTLQAEVRSLSVEASREYDLKAVLILNFTQFVEWPSSAFAGESSPFVIGVLGRDPFGRVLEQVAAGERCGGHPIEVRRFRSVNDVHDCQILFVVDNEKNDLPRILAALRGKPILTVGDSEGFAVRGGMMRLMKNPEGKIQLRINLDAVKAANLTVSAKLLRVADVAPPGG